MNQTNLSRFLSLAVVVGSVVTAARGQCQYEVTIIQAPTCPIVGPPATDGLGINELGHVVGYYQQCEDPIDKEAFLWTPAGGLVTLPRPPGVFSARATDINDVGVIVGTYWRTGAGQRGFVYDTETGNWTELPPVIEDGNGWSEASAINNAGQVVGWRSVGPDPHPHNGFIWSAKDGFTDLGLMGAGQSYASDINENGQVCGARGFITTTEEGFLWDQGILTFFGAIPGGVTSAARAINNQAQIVGAGHVQDSKSGNFCAHAFLWEDGQMTVLPMLPGHDGNAASDLNDAGHIVGVSAICADPNIRPVFILQSGVLSDLQDLAPAGIGTFKRVHAINNSGQIIVNGLTSQGKGGNVAFLLTPVGSPPTDLDFDCRTGDADLRILLNAWGQSDSPADFNGDGIVDVLDLLNLLANWTI